PSPVGMDRDRERVHLLVHEPGTGEVELGGDVGQVDQVVRRGVEVEAIPGNGLLGARPPAGPVELLHDDDLTPGLREVARRDEPVVTRSDDDVGSTHPIAATTTVAVTPR